MPKSPESFRNVPLLKNGFRLDDRFSPTMQLVLYPDRIERRQFGRVLQTIPLDRIEDVHWTGGTTSDINFSLTLKGGSILSGRLQAAGVWKFHLEELLRKGGKPARKSELPAAEQEKPRLASAA